MPLQKQAISITFAQGLDTKSDPNNLPIGKFEDLTNSVFDKLGRLTKRNGFGYITPLPDGTSTYLTTFNGNLTAIGSDIKALASGPGTWVSKGQTWPTQISTLPLIRNGTNQSYVDTAIAENGLVCSVYTDNVPSTVGTATVALQKYVVSDSVTGQNVVPPTTIISTFGTVTYAAKVFTLGRNFIVAFTPSNGGAFHLEYFPLSISTGVTGTVTTITTNIFNSVSGAFDGVVANNNLVFTWNGAANSGIKSAYLTQNLAVSNTSTIATSSATIVSVTADNTGNSPVFWNSFYASGSSSGGTVATTLNAGSGSSAGITTLFSAKSFSSGSTTILNLASTAQRGALNLWYEVQNKYSYTAASTSYINQVSVTQTGSVGASATIIRSLGLYSKGFIINSVSYFVGAFSSPYQPTYFTVGSAASIVSKLAYSNGGGYAGSGVTSVNVTASTTAQFGYLFKDLVEAVNKDTNVSAGTQVNGIYSQTGINLATEVFSSDGMLSVETGGSLQLNGGLVRGYDGFQIVENNFNVYPEPVVATIGSGGSVGLTAQTYYYQAVYRWSDNQGNVHRSAPSIPALLTISTSTLTVGVVNVPTLRLTAKTQNPVNLEIYRWSTAQQTYYQVTSIIAPVRNDLTIDSIAYTDSSSDATILGNNIIYTDGGVIENIGAPPSAGMTIFDSRFWVIDAEDRNLLWFSKQVIQTTPVEMSDLLTLFVPPASGAQGPTGPMTALAPMDDKLIIFKKNAIYYINGVGPDNTGANNQYSQPIFITGTVGCDNENSIVMTPNGLMFQSDKGIWLLGRDLSTSYVGKDVEIYNGDEVLSALCAPATNQVRFTLNTGIQLMFDYFVGQWGTFQGAPGISSTLYQGLHTFINNRGLVFQETPGLYLDGASPVLMSFTTGWLNLAGLQGYQRAYRAYLLGNYYSPHQLSIGIAYDYRPSQLQMVQITPTNYSPPWGEDVTWGSGSFWGGESNLEQWQINFQRQSCQTFQLTLNEFFDASFETAAGAGLTISGLDLVYGQSKGYPRNIGKDNKIG